MPTDGRSGTLQKSEKVVGRAEERVNLPNAAGSEVLNGDLEIWPHQSAVYFAHGIIECPAIIQPIGHTNEEMILLFRDNIIQ